MAKKVKPEADDRFFKSVVAQQSAQKTQSVKLTQDETYLQQELLFLEEQETAADLQEEPKDDFGLSTLSHSVFEQLDSKPKGFKEQIDNPDACCCIF